MLMIKYGDERGWVGRDEADGEFFGCLSPV